MKYLLTEMQDARVSGEMGEKDWEDTAWSYTRINNKQTRNADDVIMP